MSDDFINSYQIKDAIYILLLDTAINVCLEESRGRISKDEMYACEACAARLELLKYDLLNNFGLSLEIKEKLKTFNFSKYTMKNEIKIIKGDLLTTGAQFIVHQTNCTSSQAAGLAKDIFNQFPYSDCYKNRLKASSPGTIEVCGDGLEKRFIINLFGQYFPGPPAESGMDSASDRKKYFHNGLLEISKIPNLKSIAFPYKIACGLGGGDWNWYFNHLQKFANSLPNIDVLIYVKSF